MFTVLFTAVGRRVELIDAFKASFKKNNIPGKVYGVDNQPDKAPAAYFADAVFRVPRFDSEDYVDELLMICKRQQVDLLIPLYEPEFLLLDKYREHFLMAGTLVLLSNKEVLKRCADKYNTFGFFKHIGVATPDTWLSSNATLIDQEPLIAKPRAGMGSQGICIAKHVGELHQVLNQSVVDMIVQQYIEGTEYTIDVLADLNGQVLSVVPRERLEVRSGEVSKSRTVDRPDLIEQAIYIVDKLETIGPLTLQCIDTGKGTYWIEINPRFGGGVPLAIAAGVDYPYILYKLAKGEKVEPLIGQYNKNLTMLRYDQSIFVGM